MNPWAEVLRLPLTAFVYGLEFMVRTLQTAQQMAQQLNPNTPVGGVPRGNATTISNERREMSDCGCRDQCGKPVGEIRVYDYYIISVKPCKEEVLTELKNDIVTTDMSGEAFASYAIARFCLQNPGFPPKDARYLRCCYRISCTFPRERKDCCTDDQVEILREIRDAIGGARASAA